MFNLLIKAAGWNESGTDSIDRTRVFERTAPHVESQFQTPDGLNTSALQRLPTVLMPETATRASDDQLARIVTITNIRVLHDEVQLSYVVDSTIPLISNHSIENRLRTEWGLSKLETTRTHWAIKEADLFRSLIPVYMDRRWQPSVFKLPEDGVIRHDLMSVMMPLNPGFDETYSAVRDVASELGLKCKRADDIWESHAIMEDVISLIFRSRIVIVDCSGNNPNVFYEMGIAHTLGRTVIPISRSDDALPFDIAHLRVLKYLNNREGRDELKVKLADRLQALI